ncbi:hypothetical protein [Herbaspirillum sp. ST 5-3]|uniref:hypothetical protein n=1 Tax=Oxalobacteraceae TaxID=75682 RepID=UPI001455E228|nr:hypothetical protein [Herbaspirillum sp. ST 5-3]
MNPLTRFLITLPITFPLIAFATFTDFLLTPVRGQIGSDPAKEIAEAAFKIAGV